MAQNRGRLIDRTRKDFPFFLNPPLVPGTDEAFCERSVVLEATVRRAATKASQKEDRQRRASKIWAGARERRKKRRSWKLLCLGTDGQPRGAKLCQLFGSYFMFAPHTCTHLCDRVWVCAGVSSPACNCGSVRHTFVWVLQITKGNSEMSINGPITHGAEILGKRIFFRGLFHSI